MSYANMDHAGWVQNNTKQEMSELGKTVANIIGYAGGGIYNCPINTSKTDWTNNYCIEVNWRGDMANWDFMQMSKLWVLCHRKMVRVSINPGNMQCFKLLFHQRKERTGDISRRLPDCEDIIKLVDSEFANGYGHI